MESFAFSRRSAVSQESARYQQQLEQQERDLALEMQRLEEEKKKALHELMEEVARSDIDFNKLEYTIN